MTDSNMLAIGTSHRVFAQHLFGGRKQLPHIFGHENSKLIIAILAELLPGSAELKSSLYLSVIPCGLRRKINLCTLPVMPVPTPLLSFVSLHLENIWHINMRRH